MTRKARTKPTPTLIPNRGPENSVLDLAWPRPDSNNKVPISRSRWRARRRLLHRLGLEFEWQLQYQPGSTAAMKAHAREVCPAVEAVTVIDDKMGGRLRVTVWLRWYTWLAFGLVHLMARRRMTRTIAFWGPVSRDVDVRVL